MKHSAALLFLSFGLLLSACGPKAPVQNATEPAAVEDKVESNAPLTVVNKVEDSKSDFAYFHMEYPEFGVASIDAAVLKHASQWMNEGKAEVEKQYHEFKDNFPPGEIPEFSHLMRYEVIQANRDAVDIVFFNEGYTGGAHGYFYVLTLSLDGNGNVIDPWSILGTDEATLKRVSELSREQIRAEISKHSDDLEGIDEMIAGGTEPDVENFKNIVRTKGGYRIYFDPYNVAPWAAGMQVADIPSTK